MTLPLVNGAGPAPSIEPHYRRLDISLIVVPLRGFAIIAIIPPPSERNACRAGREGAGDAARSSDSFARLMAT
jgi:hypothetical protein